MKNKKDFIECGWYKNCIYYNQLQNLMEENKILKQYRGSKQASYEHYQELTHTLKNEIKMLEKVNENLGRENRELKEKLKTYNQVIAQNDGKLEAMVNHINEVLK